MRRIFGSCLFKAIGLIAIVPILLSCNSKKEEPSLAKVKGADQRVLAYQKSYFFDQKIIEIGRPIKHWNSLLNQVADTQPVTEKHPILFNTIELLLPILKEAQRGFFKKDPSGWVKEIKTSERLTLEKEIYLETIRITLNENAGGTFKDSSWTIVATGRSLKDHLSDLFTVRWQADKKELLVQSKLNTDGPLDCTFTFQDQGLLERGHCENLTLFRVEGKDIRLEQLDYDLKKGFQGAGQFKNAKGQLEKWELRPATTINLPVPSVGRE